MSRTVKLEVITPSKVFYRGKVQLVIARTLEGDEGFMAGHSWACKLLEIGELWIQEEGKGSNEFRIAAIAGGFIDVRDSIIIYTDAAEWSEDIDMDRVLSEKAKAEDWLTHETKHDPDEISRAQIAIAKAITRMNVAEGGARRKR
ncbi:ATP synthase F1 subunit epsilon [Anaerovorax odorimutans]|uniref:ATP synthase epsilon chain n=1 Tax=Anaerovorax odorimutans TaxID=109327 RepID=A0ABT1RS60_9FIRM|nr:ATP synthase F1 subunit epsilon [Anaerovorax odorimutans]MCQ4638043.1 ATP synthase F1 subunit epsilon [Anaerovorax odorimutans]